MTFVFVFDLLRNSWYCLFRRGWLTYVGITSWLSHESLPPGVHGRLEEKSGSIHVVVVTQKWKTIKISCHAPVNIKVRQVITVFIYLKRRKIEVVVTKRPYSDFIDAVNRRIVIDRKLLNIHWSRISWSLIDITIAISFNHSSAKTLTSFTHIITYICPKFCTEWRIPTLMSMLCVTRMRKIHPHIS